MLFIATLMNMIVIVISNSLITNTAKKYLYSELFWSVFSHSDWIRRDREYLSVFSPNAGKYGLNNSEYGHFSQSVNIRMLFFRSQNPK